MAARNITIGTSPVKLVEAVSSGRRWITLDVAEDQPGPIAIGINDPNVTVATGKLIAPGTDLTIACTETSKPGNSAIYAVAEADTELRIQIGQ